MNEFDGLRSVVEKNEVVPTRRAQDFLEHPKDVYDTYHFHAQTYIPVQLGTEDSQVGIDGFAKRLIMQVKQGRSPRGYITGEFGYGKTSAGLYVWEQATNARLIALPPFQLNKFTDFIDATYGWVQYHVGRVSTSHQERAYEIYMRYTQQNLEDAAQRYNSDLATIERMRDDGLLNLAVTSGRILEFFREMTALVLDAGFEGLVLMADEIQQYITPQINAGISDPIGALFDIVQGLADDRQRLAFGFLLIMPTYQLGTIHDQRGDLIHRMRDLTLDLKTIYDRSFPARLWDKLAHILGFERLAYGIIQPETLDSLGQIATRNDLSDGPRTVVNILKLAAARFLEANGDIAPYSPVDMIDAFLEGEVAFDGPKQIQGAVTRALDYEFIRSESTLTQAVKLAAAFPQEGVTESLQAQFGLEAAFQELRTSGFGDIVIEVGDRHHPGITLRGLDAVPIDTDELTLRLREFGRHYNPSAAKTMQRALHGFIALLKSSVFPDKNWKLSDSVNQESFLGTTEFVFTGAFAKMESRFPQRDIHVRIVLDDKEEHDAQLEGECYLIFFLDRHLTVEDTAQQSDFGALRIVEEEFTAYFSPNLMRPAIDQVSRQLQDQLTKSIDSAQITPLFLLALHAYLTDLMQQGQLPKRLMQMIDSAVQRQLIEGTLSVLFNPQLGAEVDANGAGIVQNVTEQLIETRYGDQYITLMTHQRWRDNIRNYIGALERLPATSQKRGLTTLQAKKGDIADYFGLASTGLDNMLSRIPHLAVAPEGDLSATKPKPLRFCLHPLEEQILAELEDSEETISVEDEVLHTLSVEAVEVWCAKMGYKPDEVEYILRIMQARELVAVQDGYITENPRVIVSIAELRQSIDQLASDAHYLHEAFQQPDTERQMDQALELQVRLKALHAEDEDELLRLSEEAAAEHRTLEATVQTYHNNLRNRIHHAASDLPHIESDLPAMFGAFIPDIGYGATIDSISEENGNKHSQLIAQAQTLKNRLESLKADTTLTISSLPNHAGQLAGIQEDVAELSAEWRTLERIVGNLDRWIGLANTNSL